jgi:hypothetical protein
MIRTVTRPFSSATPAIWELARSRVRSEGYYDAQPEAVRLDSAGD